MATVVNLPRDERAAELGAGVGNFLNNLREQRLDKLQQDLMNKISEAEDEATAAALFADPAYQQVVTDPQRFANLTTYYGNAKPRERSILLYDENGEQKFVTYDETKEKPEEVVARSGLHVNPSRTFVYFDPESDTPEPTVLGKFRSEAEARAAMPEDVPETAKLLDETSSQILFQAMNISQGVKAQKLRERVAEYNMTQPYTAFARLIDDYENEFLTPQQFQEAWEYMTTKFGKSEWDLRDITKEGLLEDEARVRNFTRVGKDMIDEISKNRGLLTKVGGLERLVGDLQAEFSEMGAIVSQNTKWTRKDVDDPTYSDWFAKAGFAEKSVAFKNTIIDAALVVAAASGQSGRSLSDKDLDRFIGIVGGDITNPDAFMYNMAQLINRTVDNFETRYEVFTNTPWSASGRPALDRFELDDVVDPNAFYDDLEKRYPNLNLVRPTGNTGRNNPTGE